MHSDLRCQCHLVGLRKRLMLHYDLAYDFEQIVWRSPDS
jgi:hypothetical protein